MVMPLNPANPGVRGVAMAIAAALTLQRVCPSAWAKIVGIPAAPVLATITLTAFLGVPPDVKIFVVEFQFPVCTSEELIWMFVPSAVLSLAAWTALAMAVLSLMPVAA